jgi:hypothetical protein
VLAFASRASAEPTCEHARSPEAASVGLLLGYGYQPAQGVDGLGPGLGLSGGYTFGHPRFYLGATALAHLGSSERARSSTASYENARHGFMFGADVGYHFAVRRHWVLRPMLTTGVLVDSTKTAVGMAKIASTDVYGFLGPAAAMLYEIGGFELGLDLRIPVFPAALVAQATISGYLHVGYRFR